MVKKNLGRASAVLTGWDLLAESLRDREIDFNDERDEDKVKADTLIIMRVLGSIRASLSVSAFFLSESLSGKGKNLALKCILSRFLKCFENEYSKLYRKAVA